MKENIFIKISFSCSVPPGYMYQSPYLAAAAPGGLVPLPATQLSHAAAVAAASQFYEYQNAAAAAATYPGTSYNFAEAYSPYSTAAAAGMCLKNATSKSNDTNLTHLHHSQHSNVNQTLLAHQRLGKTLLPQYLPSILHGNGSDSKKFQRTNRIKFSLKGYIL